jgi:ketosteroid isomerase-like protein
MPNNTEIVEAAYAAIGRGDMQGFVAALDEQIELSEPACLPYGGVARGLREVLSMLGRAAPYLDSSKMAVERVFGSGDQVAAVLRIPLRDGSGEAEIAEHWRLRDGKATELRVYWSDPSILVAAEPAVETN